MQGKKKHTHEEGGKKKKEHQKIYNLQRHAAVWSTAHWRESNTVRWRIPSLAAWLRRRLISWLRSTYHLRCNQRSYGCKGLHQKGQPFRPPDRNAAGMMQQKAQMSRAINERDDWVWRWQEEDENNQQRVNMYSIHDDFIPQPHTFFRKRERKWELTAL